LPLQLSEFHARIGLFGNFSFRTTTVENNEKRGIRQEIRVLGGL
jgi:arginine utilization protein RocB